MTTSPADEHDKTERKPLSNILESLAGNGSDEQRIETALLLGDRALAALNSGIVITDAQQSDYPIIDCNPAFEHLTGYGRDEVLGRNCRFLQGPETNQEARAVLRAALLDKQECRVTILNYRKDGTPFWNDLAIAPVRNEQGQLTHFIGIQTDVTSRKQLEAELREQTETITIINHVGQALAAELDLHNVVQLVTEAATDLTGAQVGAFFYNVPTAGHELFTLYALAGVAQEVFAEIPLPRDTPMFGPTFRGEGVMRLDDVRNDPRYGQNPPHLGLPAGHPPVTSYMAVPVISRSKEVLGGLFFGHTEVGIFTERVERIVVGLAAMAAIAMDNARLYEQSQQAIRLRDAFLASASHELRTPITTLLGNTELLQRRAIREQSLSARDQRTLQSIAEQAYRLNELAELVLDLSLLQTDLLELDPQRVDLRALAQRALARVGTNNMPGRLQLSVPEQPVIVSADERRLIQALHQVLRNALAYSPTGSPITVRIEQDANTALIVMSDQGIGIPESELDFVFQRSYRGSNIDIRHVSGLGMGLFFVKEIITRHGGMIEVQSSEGSGSIFTMQLPLAE
ncbi:MAG: PAS domain-containing protein [Herpetosiphonaceae bacterium]|nr:PAS domain-containing protein [Herpetosiphonaceae bacterium]